MKLLISLMFLSLIKWNLTVSKCRVLIQDDRNNFTQIPIVMGKLYDDPIFDIIEIDSSKSNMNIVFTLIRNSNNADSCQIKNIKLYIVRGYKKKRIKYYKVIRALDNEFKLNDTNSIMLPITDELIIIEKGKNEGFCYSF